MKLLLMRLFFKGLGFRVLSEWAMFGFSATEKGTVPCMDASGRIRLLAIMWALYCKVPREKK